MTRQVQLRTPVAAKVAPEPTGQEIADELKQWIRKVVNIKQFRERNNWLYPATLSYNHLIDWTSHPGKRNA